MFRRSIPLLMGAPPKKRIPGPPIIHQSQRPPAPARIDFTQLGLTYPVQNPEAKFQIPRIGWAPRPAQLPSNLPFEVERAGPSASFPVYTKYMGGGTKVVTVVKKVKGDSLAFQKELRKVVEGAEITMMPGKFVVTGNFHFRIKLWLHALGF